MGIDAQVIVILGLLGGFLTPALLPSAATMRRRSFSTSRCLTWAWRRSRCDRLALFRSARRDRDGPDPDRLGRPFFNAIKGGRAFWVFLGFEALFFAFLFSGTFSLRRPGQSRLAERSVSNAPHLIGSLDRGGSGVPVSPPWGLVFGSWPIRRSRATRSFSSPLFFSQMPDFSRYQCSGGRIADRIRRRRADFRFGRDLDRALCQRVAIKFPDCDRGFCPPARRDRPGKAWSPGFPPLTAAGTFTPFLLVIILIERLNFGIRRRFSSLLSSFASFSLRRRSLGERTGWRFRLFGFAFLNWSGKASAFTTEEAIPTLELLRTFFDSFCRLSVLFGGEGKGWAWAMSALAQVFNSGSVYRVFRRAFPNDWMGLLPAAFVSGRGNGSDGAAQTLSRRTGARRYAARLAGWGTSPFR